MTEKCWFSRKNRTVWKFENFSPTLFLQKFRQTNFFTKDLYCISIWRKKFQVGENFWNYHTVNRDLFLHSTFPQHTVNILQNFREINSSVIRESNGFVKKLLNSWFDEIFFQWEIFSHFFHTVPNSQCGNFRNFPPLETFFVYLTYRTDL